MEMQTLIVAAIILAAVAYLGRRGWRALAVARAAKDGSACSGGCGCGDEH